ncbi:60 kDa jasmonate-induced protein-like [Elaeis guineensis]|uniref:rRNA N-glycosylase n=1 Tax=Elaeis guineensis var. tenera TaxID=51953 RepID=A0A6I9SCI8_ELAGV|nr:uncharacterized protein LOC105059301 [Elaeis guineensis]
MAEFEEKFNVEDEGHRGYAQLIQRLRNTLRASYSHNRPVLPPQHIPPNRWFDIVLRTGSHAIRLRIRRDNLYLDGYRNENSEQWLEFGSNPSPHLIAGSTFLGFDGDYDDLQRAARHRMERINLGQQQLITAVNLLATPTSGQERARSLIIVIQMICESIRFERISHHLATRFRESSPPPDWMLALEHGWQDLSSALLRADADPEGRFRLPQPNAMGIRTAEQAAAVLGILLALCTRRVRIPYMAATVDDGQCPLGRPLVEVFAVRVNDIDKEDPGELYGTIEVTDGLGSQYLYTRTRSKGHYESIHPGQNASLTGPARAISAYGSFTIDVALMDRDADPSPDDEVSHGKISWNVFHTTNVYDKLLFHDVDGKYGSVTVSYAVLSDAAQATVEVTLINGDGEDPADVYGRLFARNGVGESVLFWRKSDEDIEVSPGKHIPLSRSVVAVPLESSLIVRADLYDRDRDASPDDEIAKGTAEFPAQLSGTSQKHISGQYGEIRVKVTWTT